ncbi:MAG: serine/threonine protein kinase [Gemmatimonadaceae bacterium]|nr:serine/threonine protein kinase [Gemmatimonadaceae bacterium]
MSVADTHDAAPEAYDDDAIVAAVTERLQGEYSFEGEAGRGGMATVLLARRRSDGQRVALKILRRGVAQALGAHRFLREIRIASDIHAATLMPLVASGEVDGSLYYVMPFAGGGSLRQRIETERQLPIDEAIRIARAIAAGAGALHQQGYIHRDIKPENILLGEHGEAWLADFGIARALHSAATDLRTSTGIVLGTPSYMSPEQAGGEEVDGRSDLYAIGCVLYEMLAGTPPFQGASTMAVIARHMSEPPPALQVVRPAVGDALNAVVLKALAKTAADRHAHATAFIAALDAVARGDPTGRTPMRRRRSVPVRAAMGVATAGAVALGATWFTQRPPALADDRVMVFPFVDSDSGHGAEGEQLAMLLGTALERTEATTWLDGAPLLTARERAEPQATPVGRLRAVAAHARARYYIDGTVVHRNDSVTVQVRLSDATDGSVVERATESAPAGKTASNGLAIRALVRVMPALVGLSRVVNMADLSGHDPVAIDSWLRGEREFRRRRMEPALRLLQQAVAADSTLAPAAFRAAIAANWTERGDTARALIRLALRQSATLAPRQRQFATALERYFAGRADEAMTSLRPLLGGEGATADEWMLAGEIQLHLLPTVGVDSLARRAIPAPTEWPHEALAEAAFTTAVRLDPGFLPPVAHLAEFAARRGDTAAFARHATRLRLESADSGLVVRMRAVDLCLRQGTGASGWRADVAGNARLVFDVGSALRAGTAPAAHRCAIAAYSALLASQSPKDDEYWGSLVALHGIHAAHGNTERALRVVDTAVAAGLGSALGLFVLDAAAGLPVGERATPFLRQLSAAIETRGPASLWLLTLDAARRADTAQLARIHARVQARSRAATAGRLDSLVTRIAAAYLAVAVHDTTRAIDMLDALTPTAAPDELEQSLWEPLAPERLLHARLLLRRGRYADAHRVASTFDHPNIYVHLLFLRPSLELRLAAATALADPRLITQAQDRLDALRRIAAP